MYGADSLGVYHTNSSHPPLPWQTTKPRSLGRILHDRVQIADDTLEAIVRDWPCLKAENTHAQRLFDTARLVDRFLSPLLKRRLLEYHKLRPDRYRYTFEFRERLHALWVSGEDTLLCGLASPAPEDLTGLGIECDEDLIDYLAQVQIPEES